jgi:hypothetical protein
VLRAAFCYLCRKVHPFAKIELDLWRGDCGSTRQLSLDPIEDTARTDKRWLAFWANVKKTPVCWEWTGQYSNGSPMFQYANSRESAARTMFVFSRGAYPKDHAVRSCVNRWCVRPDHLFDGTIQQMSVLRSRRHKATRCKRGHSMENAYVKKDGDRDCRVCRSNRHKRWVKRNYQRILAYNRAQHAKRRDNARIRHDAVGGLRDNT